MEPQVIKSKEYIEYIGHYDDITKCAKLSALATLWAVEARNGYIKFPIQYESEINKVLKCEELYSLSGYFVGAESTRYVFADAYFIFQNVSRLEVCNDSSYSNVIFTYDINNKIKIEFKRLSQYNSNGIYIYEGDNLTKIKEYTGYQKNVVYYFKLYTDNYISGNLTIVSGTPKSLNNYNNNNLYINDYIVGSFTTNQDNFHIEYGIKTFESITPQPLEKTYNTNFYSNNTLYSSITIDGTSIDDTTFATIDTIQYGTTTVYSNSAWASGYSSVLSYVSHMSQPTVTALNADQAVVTFTTALLNNKLIIEYDNAIIQTTDSSGTFTLSCGKKKMNSDVVITANDLTGLTLSATYNGNTILSTSSTGTYTLSTAGKYMATNVVIALAEAIQMPSKGDIINIDMTGSGTPQRYRVLKNVSGTTYELLAMTGVSPQKYSSSNQTYEGSTLDTYLNSTWYNTLSSTGKSAIVDNTFRQDSWYLDTTGNPDYNGNKYGKGAYQLSLDSVSYGNQITRHVYAISIQDVLDYLEVTTSMTTSDTTLTYTNIWQMFWQRSTTTSEDVFLRSTIANSDIYVGDIYGTRGCISGLHYGNQDAKVNPAFQLDLSKIEFEINH